MKTYQEIKQELKKRCRDIKHFTPAFYADYVKAYKTAESRVINGEEPPRYKRGNVTLNHDYDAIYDSDFYNLNGGTYCEFLSVYLNSMTAYTITVYHPTYTAQPIHTRRDYFDDIDTARALFRALDDWTIAAETYEGELDEWSDHERGRIADAVRMTLLNRFEKETAA